MATVIHIRDENGKGLDVSQFEDVILPLWIDIPQTLRIIRELEYADGDVFVCSYPKTGTNWTSSMLYVLLQAKSLGDIKSMDIPSIPLLDLSPTPEIIDRSRPRVFASHLLFNRLPLDHVKNGGKVILLMRNPKDVAVSYYYHLKQQREVLNQQSWDHFLKCYLDGQGIYGSYFDYMTSWQGIITENLYTNIMVVYYEDLVQDCFEELKRIQQFLGLCRSDEFLRQIEQRCSYSNSQKDIENGKMHPGLRNEEGQSILLRKGKVGDWKIHFTKTESDAVDRICQDRLKQSIFNFRYDAP